MIFWVFQNGLGSRWPNRGRRSRRLALALGRECHSSTVGCLSAGIFLLPKGSLGRIPRSSAAGFLSSRSLLLLVKISRSSLFTLLSSFVRQFSVSRCHFSIWVQGVRPRM